MNHTALHLIARPEGLPEDAVFETRSQLLGELADDQVRVALRYISIDPAMRIWMSEQKSYWPPVDLGAVMRASAIGEVVQSKHAKFKPGQWVNGMMGVQSHYSGDGKGLQVFDAAQLPDPTWAASVFGATGLTAYFGMMEIGQPKAGETLIVSAAAGAVGSMVCQIGKNLGMRVIGIAGGPDKCAYLSETLKLDGVIDYKNEKVGKRISELAPDGVDVYFDNVGGEILDAVLRRLKLRARIVLCGGISQYNSTGPALGPANYLSLISARARMEGFVVIDYMQRAPEAHAVFGEWLKQGKLHNQIDVIEGLANFPEALRRVYQGKNFGKQLVKL
jgi:NADPH-dependent curcumin reductase